MTVGVFGAGRFGSFWAGLLSKDYKVLVFDINSDRSLPPGTEAADLTSLGRCNTVFMCVTMRHLPDALKMLAPFLSPKTLVADTCSVKMLPAQWMCEHLPEKQPLLAMHPMFGPESAKQGLSGLAVMMEPLRCAAEHSAQWEQTFTSWGLSVIRMTCEQHDREAAMSQALTHFVGRSLHKLGLLDTAIATRWYTKLKEVAEQCVRDAPELYSDMQTLNPFAGEMRERLLRCMADSLEEIGHEHDERTFDGAFRSLVRLCADTNSENLK